MIIIKTNMTEIPENCKDCDYVVKNYGLLLCPFLRDWLEDWQIKEGTTKHENCPLEKVCQNL